MTAGLHSAGKIVHNVDSDACQSKVLYTVPHVTYPLWGILQLNLYPSCLHHVIATRCQHHRQWWQVCHVIFLVSCHILRLSTQYIAMHSCRHFKTIAVIYNIL